MESWSDAELVRRCRRNEPVAWRELVRRFSPLVYRLSLRMAGDATEASDVSQEVFLRVHRSLESYDPTRPLAPWIGRITYNASLRRLERAKEKAQEPDPPEEAAVLQDVTSIDPEAEAFRKESHEYLVEALNRLSAQDRGLLLLRYREGLSDAEVAEVTGMPVNTVKTRIFRARKALRQILSGVLREGAA
ncbi:MAG: sigma-70 family RNA polymerase sigma factor [Bradymonadales bacterium]|nr:sigma-70 family RNA polymerase sigma factor [Bradymonadales bacterium]